MSHEDAEHLIFFTRNKTPLTTNNVRRRLRAVLEGTGVDGVTPHSFRRTVATFLERAGGAELAAEMLGHSSVATTQIYTLVTVDSLRDVYATAHPRAR